MRFTIEIDLTNANPNTIGELFRDQTFVGEGFGCYSNFDVRADAVPLNTNVLREFWIEFSKREASKHHVAWGFDCLQDVDDQMDHSQGYYWQHQGLEVWCVWIWDGDGHLVFRVKDTQTAEWMMVSNTDCKKDHRWEFI